MYSSNIIVLIGVQLLVVRMVRPRRLRWAGHMSRVRDGAYKDLMGKSVESEPFGRSRRRWVLEKQDGSACDVLLSRGGLL